MCTSALALPKMSIDTLLAAAAYIEKKAQQHQAVPASTPQQPSQQPNPPPPQLAQQPVTTFQHVQPTVVLQQVQGHQTQLMLTSSTQIPINVAPATNGSRQASLPNGHGHIFTTQQPVNTIRIHHKKDLGPQVSRMAVMNSFDLINPAVIDQGSGEVKRKQPPMAFRTGTREVHNKLEKNRRAHLKDCFEELYLMLPNARDSAAKKTSNLNTLDSAIKYIDELKKETAANDALTEHLTNQRIGLKQRYSTLRKEIKSLYNLDVPDTLEDGPRLKRPRVEIKQEIKIESDDNLVGNHPADAVVVTPLSAGITTTLTTHISPSPPTSAMMAVTMPSSVVGNVLKLPKSITAATPAAKDDGVGAAAFHFTSYANGTPHGELVFVPKALSADQQPHQLTAQFVSSNHHHHQNGGEAGKVIVNAQLVVKPIVVVSKSSLPS